MTKILTGAIVLVLSGCCGHCCSGSGPCSAARCQPPSPPEGATTFGADGGCQVADHAELNVQPQQQRVTYWCWAATTAMVLDYYDAGVSQCQIAKKVLDGGCACQDDGTSVPRECNQNAWPSFEPFAFTQHIDENGLSPGDIAAELSPNGCGNRPFLFTWEFSNGGGSHIMVADGFTTDTNADPNKSMWIWAINPATGPVPIGSTNVPVNYLGDSRSLVRYDYFQSWKNHHTHSRDYRYLAPKED